MKLYDRTWHVSPVLHLRERPDKRNVVYAYFYDGEIGKQGAMAKLSTGLVVRSDGKLDAALVKQADAFGDQLHAAMRANVSPREFVRERRARRKEREKAGDGDPLGLLAAPEAVTVRQGFAQMFSSDPARPGRYRKETADTRDLRKLATKIETVIGPESRWAEFDADTGRVVWIGLLTEFDGRSGFRSAERAVSLFYRTAEWLRKRKRIPLDACMRPDRWGALMREDWIEAGKYVKDPDEDGPRYTREEMEKLEANREKADPRIRRAWLLGFHYRAVQTRRATRRGWKREAVGTYGLGRLRLPGRGQKGGGVIDVDPELHAELVQATTEGDLARFERAYRSGELHDYHFVQGRTGKALHRRTFSKLFRAWEESCGVKHIDGRNWHGARRSGSDLVAEVTQDESVRDASGGWKPGSNVRETNYQGSKDPNLLARTREAQRASRQLLVGADAATEALRQEVIALVHRADADTLEEMRALLARQRRSVG